MELSRSLVEFSRVFRRTFLRWRRVGIGEPGSLLSRVGKEVGADARSDGRLSAAAAPAAARSDDDEYSLRTTGVREVYDSNPHRLVGGKKPRGTAVKHEHRVVVAAATATATHAPACPAKEMRAFSSRGDMLVSNRGEVSDSGSKQSVRFEVSGSESSFSPIALTRLKSLFLFHLDVYQVDFQFTAVLSPEHAVVEL